MRKFCDIAAFILIVITVVFYTNDEMMATYLTVAASAVLLFIRDGLDDRAYFVKRSKQVQQRRAARLKAAN